MKQIRVSFDQQYMKNGKDLIKWIIDDTSGNFKKCLVAFAKGPAETKADYLFEAMNGPGTNDKRLIDVLTQSSTRELEEVKQIYAKKYGQLNKNSKRVPGQTLQPTSKITPNKLDYDIRDDTSGDFEKILRTLLRGPKDDSLTVNETQAQADTDELYKKGEGRLGTDEDYFIQVLGLRSNLHIQAIDKYYKQKYGKSLIDAIKAETSFNFKNTLIALVKPKEVYLAERLHDAVKGLGTNDDLLVYMLAAHDKATLTKVAEAYQTLFKKSLIGDVKDDTSGDYGRLLIARLTPSLV
jgi:annexin A7/11